MIGPESGKGEKGEESTIRCRNRYIWAQYKLNDNIETSKVITLSDDCDEIMFSIEQVNME